MNKMYLGIDVGGTSVKMCLYSCKKDDFIEQWEIKSGKKCSENELIDAMISSMKNECHKHNIDIKDVSGIGIGVPGPVTDEGVVLKCANLDWGIVKLKAILAGKTGVTNVMAGNDANVAALGEMWKGSAKGYKSIMMVTLGTGVGGGLVIDGHIVPGHMGAAGEIGHMTVEPEEKDICGCGCRGCLEQYTSAQGIVRVARNKFPDVYKDRNITSKDIFDAAKDGDFYGRMVVDMFAEKMGIALSNISNVISPEIYIIGGGVSAAGDIIIEKIKQNYDRYSMYALKGVPIKLAELGNKAGMYGAVKMVIDNE